jgi:CHAT domain-containing protein
LDLNLEGTDLVTLSACDTGKGEVDYSEGVYGLVRAFRIAGARNVLMSLWPLNDGLTADFMKDFYVEWLGNPKRHPADVLRETRLAWIRAKDPKRRDPTYWAPYVLIEGR